MFGINFVRQFEPVACVVVSAKEIKIIVSIRAAAQTKLQVQAQCKANYSKLQQTLHFDSYPSLFTLSLILEIHMKKSAQTGALIATAAAAMMLAGTSFAATSTISAGDKVHCAGINSCKGTSDCKTPENACKGQNTCKGHGFVTEKAGECLAKNGKIIDLDKK